MATLYMFNPFYFLLLAFMIGMVHCVVTINYINNCRDSVWLSADPSIDEGEPEVVAGAFEKFFSPDVWSGTIWARTKCVNNASSFLTCETGDCGSGSASCQGLPPTLPVTEVNLNINNNVVSYEVSLNHGHNLPIRVKPGDGKLSDGSGPCPVVDCIADISNVCPDQLVAYNSGGKYVGCYSPCDKLKDPKYCCSGTFSGPGCQPNDYSKAFKGLCGLSHTFPGDNTPPVYQCTDATSYDIIFCPT